MNKVVNLVNGGQLTLIKAPRVDEESVSKRVVKKYLPISLKNGLTIYPHWLLQNNVESDVSFLELYDSGKYESLLYGVGGILSEGEVDYDTCEDLHKIIYKDRIAIKDYAGNYHSMYVKEFLASTLNLSIGNVTTNSCIDTRNKFLDVSIGIDDFDILLNDKSVENFFRKRGIKEDIQKELESNKKLVFIQAIDIEVGDNQVLIATGITKDVQYRTLSHAKCTLTEEIVKNLLEKDAENRLKKMNLDIIQSKLKNKTLFS